jgi:aryl-alcohol dehydrogenase-like predicted oxidoreductase
MHLGLGTASFGTAISAHTSQQLLDSFVQQGGRVIDTANCYAFWAGKGGESETVIGTWLANQSRSQLKIHTKIGAMATDGQSFESAEGLSQSVIESAIEASLTRLNTDYVDVLYAHIDDPCTPLLETWQTLSTYVKNGKVKALGISNFSLPRIVELNKLIQQHHLPAISYAQYRHSLISPIPEADLGVQLCFNEQIIAALKTGNKDIQLVAYSPLLDGAFELGKHLHTNYNTASNRQWVEQIRLESAKLAVSPSALVLKSIADTGIMPLTMTGKVQRLADNMRLFR